MVKVMHDLTDAQQSAILETILTCGEQAYTLAAQPFQVFEKGLNDYVTSVDQVLDERLLAKFQELFPQDGIITEENLKSKQAYGIDHDRYWLIDPIDGTEDFMQQGLDYAVMVGLLQYNQPVAGWIYAPTRHETYWGGPEWGLFEQTQGAAVTRLVPQPPPPVNGAICPIMIGDKDQKRFGDAIASALPTVQLTTLGSFGLKVLEVIRGRVGLYLYLNGRVKLWDTTGPIALAQAAGLVCCDLDGNPLRFDPEAVDPNTLVHRQNILVGWPEYIEALQPVIKQVATSVLTQDRQAAG